MMTRSRVKIGTFLRWAIIAVAIVGLTVALVVERRRSAVLRIERGRVLAKEIGRRVGIVGNLGKPLGDFLTIRGHWDDATHGLSKGENWEFVVTAVGGMELETPERFGWYFVRYYQDPDGLSDPLARPTGMVNRVPLVVSDSATWELRGYESGRFDGHPDDYGDELHRHHVESQPSGPPVPPGLIKPVAQKPVGWPFKYGFYSSFTYISARPVPP